MTDMTPVAWATRPLKKYADFSGRAPRAEYWWFTVASGIIGYLLGFLDAMLGGPVAGAYGPVSLLFTLALIVPGLAVTVRRLHDGERSGWWILLNAGSYVFMIVGFLTAPEQIAALFKGGSIGLLFGLIAGWLIGAIVLLVFMVTRGTEGANRYGPDPYGRDALEEVFA